MKNSFYIDLQRFMLIPTKFLLSHDIKQIVGVCYVTFEIKAIVIRLSRHISSGSCSYVSRGNR